jgi:murein DD-endopeptidase MepM/ murein hydrolase activator NlpD
MPAGSPTAAAGPVVLDAPDSKERGLQLEDPAADPTRPALRSEVAATTGEPLLSPAAPTSLPMTGVIGDLRRHNLRLPIDDANVETMKGGFDERRDAGGRPHEAVDILSARNTPIRAVEDGTIAKLFTSKAGGYTVYQFDPSGSYSYYYAHLERYAPGLHDGQHVSQGEVIGFVGSSGNAPANTPHLHFAVFELDADRHWWKGRAIDPYLVFRP